MKTGPIPLQDMDNDNELVRAAADGNIRAFDELVLAHKDKVFNICYWFLCDYHEADDMAQEVFIKAFQSLKSFRFEAKFSTWLYRIAVNTCKNRVKSLGYRLKKWTKSLDSPDMNPGFDGNVPQTDPSDNPQELLERKEQKMQIQRAVNTLKGDKKTVVLLRDIEGMSYDEIAKITGLAIGTVKSRLARARAELQEKLKDV